jgi:phosphatidate cytidylyltransferase
MLRTRLIVGSILVAATAGMLLADERFAPWFPFLFATVTLLAILGTLELYGLLPPERRPRLGVCIVGVVAVVVLGWGPVVVAQFFGASRVAPPLASHWVLPGFTAVVLAIFLAEMAAFREPGRAVERIAVAVWAVAYLGLLPSFLAQLRTDVPAATETVIRRGTIALALAVFVPKGCDIGAYFTGRLLGRHRMTPALSPKKTWEGAAGGLAMAVLVAFAIDRYAVIPGGFSGIVGFGLTVGLAGMLGDLAESLIKRDCQQKDASQSVPGFGGILDVVDSIIFAAPVVYWWLR